jgi:endonuclease/exonuclease/phosphatase family metal-dependent hydrolase
MRFRPTKPFIAVAAATLLAACGDDRGDPGGDAPDTVVDTQPAALTGEDVATIGFSSPAASGGRALAFECALDGDSAFTACTSPLTRSALGSGRYSVAVRARWVGGAVDASPALAEWTVDRTAPTTSITAGPDGDADVGAAAFAFASEPGASYDCRVDRDAFARCTSPWTVQVTLGSHVFEVRAVDALGNVEATPARRMFRGVTPGSTGKVRLVAANLTSGSSQSYDPGHGARILQGLRPDIVMIQELNVLPGNGDAELRAWVDATFGAGFQVYREVGAQIPNGVISRYPILAAGTWEDVISPNREFVWARLDVPGPKDLWAISVHLLTRDAPTRDGQAQALRDLIAANVPATDYLVIGGDFNTNGRDEACITTLGAVVSTAAPYPVDQAGNGNTNAARAKPYDWLLLDAELRATQVPVVVGAASFASGLVFDSRVYTPLTDVAPTMIDDSAATNMQHMAVVIDAQLPL